MYSPSVFHRTRIQTIEFNSILCGEREWIMKKTGEQIKRTLSATSESVSPLTHLILSRPLALRSTCGALLFYCYSCSVVISTIFVMFDRDIRRAYATTSCMWLRLHFIDLIWFHLFLVIFGRCRKWQSELTKHTQFDLSVALMQHTHTLILRRNKQLHLSKSINFGISVQFPIYCVFFLPLFLIGYGDIDSTAYGYCCGLAGTPFWYVSTRMWEFWIGWVVLNAQNQISFLCCVDDCRLSSMAQNSYVRRFAHFHHKTISVLFFFSIYFFAIQFFRFCFRCSPSILISDVNSAEQWYFKFRNWCSVVVRGEWLWLHANISDEHNIGGSVSTGATRIRGWMPARMVHRGNYTVDGAIMFGGNFHENLIQFQSSKRWLDICLSLCEKVLGLIGSMCIASVFFDDDDRCK